MRKTAILTGVAAFALMFAGCGGDKKVEERVAEIQSNAPTEANVTSTSTAASEVSKAAADATSKEAPKAAAKEATKEEPKSSSSSTVDAKQLYGAKCAACHGQNGEGKGAYPKLAGNSKDDALKKLNGYVDGTYGKAQKMIMAGQAKALSDAERAAVAEYIATFK